MTGVVINSLSSDPIANMMLSSSVWITLKNYINKKIFSDKDFATLNQGRQLLNSIVNGFAFMTPLTETRFNDVNLSLDIDIFNDTASLFFREKEIININKLTDYRDSLTSLIDQNHKIESRKLDELVGFFEDMAEQFFIRAKYSN